MLEKYLIDCCSPTLASLKLGSLFNCTDPDYAKIQKSVNRWNIAFSSCGIKMRILRNAKHSKLIYVYREADLRRALCDPEISEFLSCCGYNPDNCNTDQVLDKLSERIELSTRGKEVGFPHEIGVFLGYPLEDVKGFIVNHGKNFKYTGIWKVYGNEAQALKTFAKFNKCSDVYKSLWTSGRKSILQLTVAS